MIPCHLNNLPLINAGITIINITMNIKGISTNSAAFIPNSNLSAGIENGESVIAKPDTKTKLNKFAPIMLPNDNNPWPFINDVIAVTSSGKDVPKATNVKAITDSGTPRNSAIIVPLSTRRLAPIAINTAPTTRNPIFFVTEISSFSSLLESAFF